MRVAEERPRGEVAAGVGRVRRLRRQDLLEARLRDGPGVAFAEFLLGCIRRQRQAASSAVARRVVRIAIFIVASPCFLEEPILIAPTSAARYLSPPLLSVSSTWSRLKLPTFWLGGNSLNDGEELPDVLLRRHEEEHAIDPPVVVVHAMVGRFERIGAEVVDLGHAQGRVWLLPAIEAFAALLLEDDLVLLVAQRGQVAVVAEVEELLARAGRLAGERVGEVVAVEVHLEGLVADLHPLEQLLLDVGDAGGGQQRGQHVFVGEDVVDARCRA